MVRRPAETAKTFDDAGGNVGRRRIDHGVVIGKGNVAEKLAIVVAVKGTPTAVAILHAQKPLNAAAHGSLHARSVGKPHTLESHQDEGGVVNIGIKIVAK